MKHFFVSLFFGIILCISSVSLKSQNAPELPKLIPTSPTVAAMAKFGEIPVSLYTGIPNIEIPLYTLKSKGLDIPVSIRYHAGGIRVEDAASNTGLGWSLSAGGSITRQVRGTPDNGTLYTEAVTTRNELDLDREATQAEYEDLDQSLRGVIDSEADIFYYNIPGASGKFALFPDHKYHCFPENTIKIENVGMQHSRFIITSSDGCKYIFGACVDMNESTFVRPIVPGEDPYSHSPVTITAWHLTDIILPSSDTIHLTYTRVKLTNFKTRSKENMFLLQSGQGITASYLNTDLPRETWNTSTMDNYYLKTIETKEGKVIFDYNIDRIDVYEDKALSGIRVEDALGNQVLSYLFRYKYLCSSNEIEAIMDNPKLRDRTPETLANYRMILDRIDIGNAVGSYRFEYETNVRIPSRFSKAMDHWGYYNGQTGNNSLIPDQVFEKAGRKYISGINSNRESAPQYMQAGILKKIIYPTKGYTAFTYQSNDIWQGGYSGTRKEYVSSLLAYEKWEGNVAASESDYKKEITINGQETSSGQTGANCRLEIKYFLTDFNHAPIADHNLCKTIVIKGISNSIRYVFDLREWLTEPGQKFLTLFLPNGRYSFEMVQYEHWTEAQKSYSLLCDLSWSSIVNYTVGPKNYPVGGLRVIAIENFDSDGKSLTKKTYSYTNGSNQASTGKLFITPDYRPDLKYATFGDLVPTEGKIIRYTDTYYVYESVSNYALLQTQASYVGYDEVCIEEINADGRYKSVSQFSQPFFYSNQHTEQLYPPADFLEWTGGLLLYQKDYEYKNGNYRLIRELNNNYADPMDAPLWNSLVNVKVDKYLINRYGVTTIFENHISSYLLYKYYTLHTGWSYLFSSMETTYDGNNNPSSQYTYFAYDNPSHMQLTRKETTNSTGKNLYNFYRYPQDEIQGLSSSALQAKNRLVSAYRLSELLEEESFEGNKHLFKVRTNYNPDLWPSDIEWEKGNSPLEKRISFTSYDKWGNIQEIRKDDGLNYVYLWSYCHRYPVAEIKNATYVEIENILTKSYIDLLSGSLNPDIIKLSNLRNDIRLKNAGISTYTYKLMVGIESATDDRGVKTTFHYDGLNRLASTRDNEGHVIESYIYNFQK